MERQVDRINAIHHRDEPLEELAFQQRIIVFEHGSTHSPESVKRADEGNAACFGFH